MHVSRLSALVLFGLSLIAIAFAIYGQITITKTSFIIASMIGGLGFAFALGAPMRVIVLNEAAAEDRGAAQGLLNVSINIGQLLGAAMVGGITASFGGGADGYQMTYTVMGVITASLVLLALRLRSQAAQQKLEASMAAN